MNITLHTIKIRDLVDGYADNDEAGVTGYGGKLDIRPPYQREFCYNDNQQQAVMDTVTNRFPLNTMYWVVREDGRFEVLDGQQRTISICRYVNGSFSHNMRYFTNLQADEKERILNYELQVYFCEGTESEKLSWFKTINIAGERLTNQEIRNAVFAGTWTAEAKKIFSKSNCAAKLLGDKYVNGNPIRQELLETVLGWYAGKDDKLICSYMGKHQNDTNANEIWVYFQMVIAVEPCFTSDKNFFLAGTLSPLGPNQILLSATSASNVSLLLTHALLAGGFTTLPLGNVIG